MIRAILSCVIALSILYMPATTRAHVLITEPVYGAGAVVHINPNDDPVAGDTAVLYYELGGGQLNAGEYDFLLIVHREGRLVAEAPAQVLGSSSVRVEYVFPAQGLYQLELRAVSRFGKEPTAFTQSLQVTRGVGGGAGAAHPSHARAEIGVVMTPVALIAILIYIVNHRHEIAQFSRDESKRRS